MWVPFIEADPNNPPKCKTCNDYGGILDNETYDYEGLPHMMVCPDCYDDINACEFDECHNHR